eukprot:6179429-Pleurochrysis_carterae.AAC.1
MSKLNTRLKIGAKRPPVRELLKSERSPFWAASKGYKRDKSAPIFSFPCMNMGQLDVNKVSSVYPNEFSRSIVPLRPSRVILTVPKVDINQYWLNSCLWWELRCMAPHDRKYTMALSMFIAGSVDLSAMDLRAQPAYIHIACNLPVRRVLM